MFTLVTYSSWFPPFVVIGTAMVRYRRLTGKLPIETFDERTSLIIHFQTDQMRNKMEIFYLMGERTLTVKLNSGPMSSSVLTVVITGEAASAT